MKVTFIKGRPDVSLKTNQTVLGHVYSGPGSGKNDRYLRVDKGFIFLSGENGSLAFRPLQFLAEKDYDYCLWIETNEIVTISED